MTILYFNAWSQNFLNIQINNRDDDDDDDDVDDISIDQCVEYQGNKAFFSEFLPKSLKLLFKFKHLWI